MDKKYRLTDETIQHHGITLYRIEALHDFGDIKKGDKGGFVEREDNLSHYGTCWIYNNAKVFGKARVSENACIYYRAEIYGNAKVYEKAKICDNVKVYDDAEIYGDAQVGGKVRVYGEAIINCLVAVFGNVQIFDNAYITGFAIIQNNVKVYGNTWIGGSAVILDYAEIFDNAQVTDMSHVYGKSKVCGNAVVSGNARIGDAIIEETSDYIVFKNWWSSGRYFTWTKSNNMWSVGCFYGTGEELIAKAYRDSELSGREYGRIVRYVESINQPAKRLNCIQKIVCKLFNIK